MWSLDEDTVMTRIRRYAQSVFFEAMQSGYIDDKSHKSTILELPGSRHIAFVSKEWKVTDTYMTSPKGDGSGGMTVIFYEEIPIWMMQYYGRYPKETIPFLKKALTKNYEDNIWFGGRGPNMYQNNGWSYINMLNGDGKFDQFSGHEIILGPDGKETGFHRYSGGWLINR